MATAHDVAAYITEEMGPTTAMKLQKLVYYAQAWHLVWDQEPLFPDKIEAWANGPVVRSLYATHRLQFTVTPKTFTAKGDPTNLTDGERETVDVVVEYYGDKSAQWLSELTHSEPPWRDARHGLSPADKSTREITKAAMAEYYGSL